MRVRILDHDERRRGARCPTTCRGRPRRREYIDSLGLDVRPVVGFGTLMHHKYAVVDGERVWTGSMNWTEDSFTLQENCIVTLESPTVAAAYLRDFEELWNRPRHLDKSGRFDTDWSDATFGGRARARAPVLLPGPRARARRADRQPHRVRARAHPDLLAGADLGPDPGRALRCRRARASCPSRASSTARRCRTCCGSGAGSPKASWKPAAFRFVASKAGFGGKRSIPWGPHTVHDFLHAKLVVCDDWAFVGSYNHSRAGEENAENVLAMDGKAVADHVAEAIAEFATRYAPEPGDSWESARSAARVRLTRQLDGRRPQLAAELLEHRAAQLGDVHRQGQRVLAQAREQRRALEHLVDPGAVARDDELVERAGRAARGSPPPARVARS